MIPLEQVSATSRLRPWSVPVTLFCMGLLGVALVAPVYPGSLLVLASAWTLAWGIAKIPFAWSLCLLKLPLGFLLLSVVMLCVSVRFGIDGVSCHWVSSQLPFALQTGLRSFAAMSTTLCLVMCVPVSRMLGMLRSLRVPEYVIDFVQLMYRMIFLLDDSRGQIWLAQKNRLGNASFRSAFRSVGMLAASLWEQSQRKAMRMDLGLAARGGSGQFAVVSLPEAPIPLRIWGVAIAWPMFIFALSIFGSVYVH